MADHEVSISGVLAFYGTETSRISVYQPIKRIDNKNGRIVLTFADNSTVELVSGEFHVVYHEESVPE